MKLIHQVVIGLISIGTFSAHAQTPAGLEGLEQAKKFQTMRASSCDADWKNGNGDARPIEPGGTLTVAELQGPGKIVHIWCTIAHEAAFYSRLMTLRIYWDGEENPSVECPIGDFFGIGHGVDKSFTSIPIRVTSDGRGRNCYWPMPFRKSARITVTNGSDRRCHAFYYYIDWQKQDSLPEDALYFHAMYRQEHPCVMGRNYLLADIEGRGHYVGTIQSVYMVSPGWYGEGDDFFFVDGEKEPSLRGTGTEDYFCDGWGFREQSGPYYGTPVWEGYDTGNRSTAYRFHLPDPIVFKQSLRAEIEHKGSQSFPDGKGDGFIERDDLMSSVALWYQTEPHKKWSPLPAGPDRLPFREKAIVVGYESLDRASHSGDPLEIQPFGGVTDGKQLWFRADGDKDWIEIPFEIEKQGRFELIGKLLHSWDYGTYAVKLDSEEIAQVDLYSASAMPATHSWGSRQVSAGPHRLRFECVGKSDKSKGYFLGFDALVVRIPVYSRPPSVDLRTLQKSQ